MTVGYGRQRGIGGVDDLVTTDLTRSLYLRPKRRQMRAGYDVSYRAEVLRDNPIGFWMLDEPSGTIATDLAVYKGTSRNGTYTNSPTLAQASLVGGLESSALASTSFDGTNDYIDMGYQSDWRQAEFTFVCAFRTGSTMSGAKAIATRDSGSGSIGRSWYVVTSGTDLYFSTFEGSTQREIGPVALATSTVYHLAVTYSSAAQKVYLNGVEVLSVARSSGANDGNTQPLYIGRYAATYWNGRIQGAAFYGTALSATRILAHATAAGLV